jgi:hypothetical protein
MNDPRNPQDPRFAATHFAPDAQPGQPAQPAQQGQAANPFGQPNPYQQPQQQPPGQTAYAPPAAYGPPGGQGPGAGADPYGQSSYGQPPPQQQQQYQQHYAGGQQPDYGQAPPGYGQPPGGFGYNPQTQQSYGNAPPGAYQYPVVGPGGTSEGEIASTLKVLAVVQYVYAGLTAVFSVFALLWVVLGGAMIAAGATGGSDAAGEAGMGAFMVIIAVVMLVVLGVVVGLHVLAAKSLNQRRRHTFLIVVACLTLLSIPIGTAIGIWMLVTLTKPEVKATFT